MLLDGFIDGVIYFSGLIIAAIVSLWEPYNRKKMTKNVFKKITVSGWIVVVIAILPFGFGLLKNNREEKKRAAERTSEYARINHDMDSIVKKSVKEAISERNKAFSIEASKIGYQFDSNENKLKPMAGIKQFNQNGDNIAIGGNTTNSIVGGKGNTLITGPKQRVATDSVIKLITSHSHDKDKVIAIYIRSEDVEAGQYRNSIIRALKTKGYSHVFAMGIKHGGDTIYFDDPERTLKAQKLFKFSENFGQLEVTIPLRK